LTNSSFFGHEVFRKSVMSLRNASIYFLRLVTCVGRSERQIRQYSFHIPNSIDESAFIKSQTRSILDFRPTAGSRVSKFRTLDLRSGPNEPRYFLFNNKNSCAYLNAVDARRTCYRALRRARICAMWRSAFDSAQLHIVRLRQCRNYLPPGDTSWSST